MLVDGTEYGEVRQYGKFSFARIYESGHEIPYYQRKSDCFPFPDSFANQVYSRGRTRVFQPHDQPLRHRDGREEGHCGSGVRRHGECDAYEFVCAVDVVACAGVPDSDLSDDDYDDVELLGGD
jgi:hypothetical protein